MMHTMRKFIVPMELKVQRFSCVEYFVTTPHRNLNRKLNTILKPVRVKLLLKGLMRPVINTSSGKSGRNSSG
jgi:hypothetical protein